VSPSRSERHVFLSYAAADRDRAVAMADALEAAGIPVWIDRRGIAGGDLWASEISAAIRSCATLAVLCTRASVGSRNVRQEVQLAWDYDRPILPLLLEPVDFPDEIAYFLRGRQWIEVADRQDGEWVARIASSMARSQDLPARQADMYRQGMRSAAPAVSLPLPPLSIVGRDHDIADIAALLRSGIRLLTLTGPGGIGKTTLAVAVASAMVTDYPDGVWFVDLVPLQTPETSISAIAQLARVRELGVDSAAADLATALRDRRALLVFDNAEHLPGIGDVIGGLLAATSELTALVTSRRPLHLRNEREWPVGALSVGMSGGDLASIASAPAVQLFVDRANQLVPTFHLTESNVAQIASICQRLDGLPLAIELAAKRLRLYSPVQLLAKLDQSLAVLTSGAGDAPARQRTLRQTVLWSVDLLSPSQQMLFRRLAVFAGGFTLEAVEAVVTHQLPTYVEPLELLDDLDALVDSGLVVRSENEIGEVRLSMLATIHDVAQELLESSGESTDLRNLHAAWCLEHSGMFQVGYVADPERMQLARTELPNFRSALTWLEEKQEATAYKTMMGTLGITWSFIDMQETQQLYRRAPQRLEVHDPAVDLRFLAGWLVADKEWFETHQILDDTFRDLQALCEAHGDTIGGAFAAHEWSNVHVARRDWAAATESLGRARSLWDSTAQPLPNSVTTLGQGAVEFYQGRFEQAGRRFQEAMDLSLTIGNRLVIAFCEAWLGLVDAAQGRPGPGATHSLRALNAIRDTAMVTALAGWLGGAAWIVGGAEPEYCWTYTEACRVQRKVRYNFNLAMADARMLPALLPCASTAPSDDPITLDNLLGILEGRLLELADPHGLIG
jgi:predicted ATPase